MLSPSYSGIPLIGSPLIPEGQLVKVDGRLYFHQRPSRRVRWRRPHGRHRGPRRRVERVVTYQPDLDRIREELAR